MTARTPLIPLDDALTELLAQAYGAPIDTVAAQQHLFFTHQARLP